MDKNRNIETFGFYQSWHWIKVATYIRNKYNHICQRCGKHGSYVHHIDPLKPEDYINKPLKKCYGEDNLTLLCHDCHEKEHSRKTIREGTYIDKDGQLRLSQEGDEDND